MTPQLCEQIVPQEEICKKLWYSRITNPDFVFQPEKGCVVTFFCITNYKFVKLWYNMFWSHTFSAKSFVDTESSSMVKCESDQTACGTVFENVLQLNDVCNMAVLQNGERCITNLKNVKRHLCYANVAKILYYNSRSSTGNVAQIDMHCVTNQKLVIQTPLKSCYTDITYTLNEQTGAYNGC